MMDSPPDFFADCMPDFGNSKPDFGDSNLFPATPNSAMATAEDLAESQHAFSSYAGAGLGTDSPATSSMLGRQASSRSSTTWDNVFLEPRNTVDPNVVDPNTVDPTAVDPDAVDPLFLDPILYGGRSEVGPQDPQPDHLSQEDSSRPSSRRASSSNQSEIKSASAFTEMTVKDGDSPGRQGTPDGGSPKRRKTPDDDGDDDDESPKKRRRRKGKGPAETREMEESEERRLKFLERNRIAASKCREKKKAYVSDLEDRKNSLEAQNMALRMEGSALHSEVGALKRSLMAHARCGNTNIETWLDNEARRFAHTGQGVFGTIYAELGPLGMAPNPHAHSRNHSIASTSYQSLAGLSMDGMSPGERRGSMAYSHASSLQTSPTDTTFPTLHGPLLEAAYFQQALNKPELGVKIEPGINYDHMPDTMFDQDHQPFGGG